MKYLYTILVLALILRFNSVVAQKQVDTAGTFDAKTYNMCEVDISSDRAVKGIGQLKDEVNCVIYAGKKTEVLTLDSITANTAQDNSRQVMGKLPGAVFTETEGAGFPSNGIAFRGVNPYLSVETNVRQNGYNISADLFGYNDAYYTPPLEGVSRIEVVRGAASLQFGPQFGGAINYHLKEAPEDTAFTFSTEQTMGSFGYFSSYTSIGGTYKGFSYFGYFDASITQGWRPNSDFRQFSGFVRLQYKFKNNIILGAEYTPMQNRIHMPGGLSDAQFDADPRVSFRRRNWLSTPWNVVALTLDAKIGKHSSLSSKLSYVHSSRKLTWFPEYSGPGDVDTIEASTGQYVHREVELETFRNFTAETRYALHYNIGNSAGTFATGLRFYYGRMGRNETGTGTTGSDFNFNLDEDYGTKLKFTTTNVAPFFENVFQITDKFSITPGFRFEFIHSTIDGFTNDYGGYAIPATGSRNRYIPLAGLTFQYKTTSTTQLYANIAQAYRPIDYDALTPFGTTSVIDQHMKDASGFNGDIGFRGTYKSYLAFDADVFCMLYKNTIGLEQKIVADDTFDYRTNVANSIHAGLEAYIEVFPIKIFTQSDRYGQLSIFSSFSHIHAQYSNGIYKGKWVENAPNFIERAGITYSIKSFAATFNVSYTSKSFTDADNTVHDPDDADVGVIPAYVVMDISASYKFKNRLSIKAGVNNVANAKYFTMRVDEYPGPGIIPAIGRSFYLGFGVHF